MAETMTTDVRALLDRNPFDASAVADLREVLGRDPSRYATLRDAVAALRDRSKGKTSSVSSRVDFDFQWTATLLIRLARAPMNRLSRTVTNPAAGVIATSPTTAPMHAP